MYIFTVSDTKIVLSKLYFFLLLKIDIIWKINDQILMKYLKLNENNHYKILNDLKNEIYFMKKENK